MKYLKTQILMEHLEGFQTIDTIMRDLSVPRQKAIHLIHRLRQAGYVKTFYGKNKMRQYSIGARHKYRRVSYTDIINQYAPVAVADSSPYYIYGRNPKPEEAIIYALQKGEIRFVIACLALYKRIDTWFFLYYLAKKNGLLRQVSALYDVARLVVRKLRRMPKQFHNFALPKKDDKFIYIIHPFESEDPRIKKIEDKWKVKIPLNWSDLDEYRGIRT